MAIIAEQTRAPVCPRHGVVLLEVCCCVHICFVYDIFFPLFFFLIHSGKTLCISYTSNGSTFSVRGSSALTLNRTVHIPVIKTLAVFRITCYRSVVSVQYPYCVVHWSRLEYCCPRSPSYQSYAALKHISWLADSKLSLHTNGATTVRLHHQHGVHRVVKCVYQRLSACVRRSTRSICVRANSSLHFDILLSVNALLLLLLLLLLLFPFLLLLLLFLLPLSPHVLKIFSVQSRSIQFGTPNVQHEHENRGLGKNNSVTNTKAMWHTSEHYVK